ncbi:type I polyketide synthase [Streptomyces sp. NPDC047002]|uniref:type I polyketide synthase n=1 Tax=Streptomyces sp. NPDC047002 TaxID=3155475 RepID=UPI0034551973
MNDQEQLVGYLRRLTAELRAAKDRVAELEERADAAHAPVAVVGMACRYPGADSPEALWRLVAEGRDATGPVPAERGWLPPAGGEPWRGGFLADAAGFDAAFFGISPREATAMDPQQRLLLEVAWEAFEDAGIDPRGLRGGDTAVFAGANQQAYGPPLHESPPEVAGHRLTGMAGSVVSGRIAYVLGLRGPALTVDTACSSSLVAVHLACRALRSGETGLALAAGVTVMSTSGTAAEFGRQGGLAADGRCKAFGAGADGTGLAEGAGVLVLERLADARRHGHRVLAVLKGSAVNQDGASNGLSAPSGPAQRAVIEAALADAGLSAADVDAVEAHGTGTPLGDPIEAGALIGAYGGTRPDGAPLWLGSLKSNIGHAQAAAGVGGLIKTIGALRHEELPRTLHAEPPTPHVDWSAGTVRLLAAARTWPRTEGRPRRAGVSSFGISGTNAHVLVEEAPADAAAPDPDGPGGAALLALSGHSEDALRAQAARVGAHLADHHVPLRDVARTLGGRAALAHRAAAVVRDTAEARAVLAALASGTGRAGLTAGHVPGGRRRAAFLFCGADGVRAGAGAGLYAAYPVFRAAFDEVCALADPLLGTSLRGLALPGGGSARRIEDAAAAQAALLALQVAQFRLLGHWGLVPDVVLGDGAGEVAAAVAAEVLSLPDAVALTVARGRAARPGSAASVAAAEDRLGHRAALQGGEVRVTAVYGAESVTVAGGDAAVRALLDGLRADGVRGRLLPGVGTVPPAPGAPGLVGLAALAAGFAPRPAGIPVVSGLTGRGGDTLAEPGYWVRQASEPVRFADAVRTAVEVHGADTLLELGPGAGLVAHAAAVAPPEALVLALAPAGHGPAEDPAGTETAAALEAAGLLYVHGLHPRLPAVVPGRHVDLPGYAFQRERYWLPDRAPQAPQPRPGPVGPRPGGECLLTERFDSGTRPWTADHVVGGRVLLPATAFLELALRAGRRAGHPYVTELVLHTPLDLTGAAATDVRATAVPGAAGGLDLVIASRPAAGGPWTAHAAGRLGQHPPAGSPAPGQARPPLDAVPRPLDGHYARCERLGLSYGPAFRTLAEVSSADGVLYARSTATAEPGGVAEPLFAPAALDAVLQALLTGPGAGQDPARGTAPRLPFSWSSVTVHRTAAGPLSARITPVAADTCAVEVEDADGLPVLSVGSLVLRPVPARHDGSPEPALLRPGLSPLPPGGAGAAAPAPWLLGTPPHGLRGFVRSAPDLPALLAAVDRAGGAPAALLVAPGPAAARPGDPVSAVHAAAAGHLALLQGCLHAAALAQTVLVLVTRDDTAGPGLVAAAVRGLWRSAAREHPGRLGLLHLRGAPGPDGAVATAVARLAREARDAAGVAELTLVDGVPHAPSTARAAEAPPGAPAFDPEGTVLVTGGGGALAAALVPHLVARHGVRHLVLACRSGRLPRGVAGLGADVRAVACDVADRAAVRDLVAAAGERHPLRAVVHAAGVLDDATVARMRPEQLHRVLRPKADGAWHLHEATRRLPLTRFVLFGSAAASLGTAGQANYAAANAFLDALAVHRAASGLPGLTIGWGWWEETGMTRGLPQDALQRLRGLGLRPMAPAEGLALFDRALGAREPVVLAGRFDTDTGTSTGQEAPLPPAPEAAPAPPEPADGAGARPATRQEWVDRVRALAAAVLGHPSPDRLDPDAELSLAGLDSLGSLELRDRLVELCGRPLPLTVLLEHPSAAALGAHLHGLPPAGDGGAPGAPAEREGGQ